MDDKVKEMEDQIEKLRATVRRKESEAEAAVRDAKAARAEVQQIQDSYDKPIMESAAKENVVYLTQPRRLERFRGKPTKPSDMTVHEWVEDAEAILATRKFSKADKATWLIEHLSGEARREVCGRGPNVKNDPDRICAVLIRTFGDGDTIPQLQQQFFAYKQGEKEDLVTCSLKLVDIYERMIKLDPSLEFGADAMLRSRFPEAVREESVAMELRRLITDHPELTFFEARDQVIALMGHRSKLVKPKSDASLHQVTVNDELKDIVKQLGVQIANQQKQIDSLTKLLKPNINKPIQQSTTRSSQDKSRVCWHCNSPGHFRRDCPARHDEQTANDQLSTRKMKPLN